MGRNAARGVRGMMLDDGQSVIAMLVAEDETQSVLTATENGYGKRTRSSKYTRHGRGTKGMIAIQQSERNGKVVAATLVRADDEIMLITDTGVLVRTRVAEIRELGRATQGVTLIALDEGAKLIGLQRIVENDAKRRRQRRRRTARGLLPSCRPGAGRRRLAGACAGCRRRAGGLLLAVQQPSIEALARNIVERPAVQMMQPPARPCRRRCRRASARDATSVDADIRKFVDEVHRRCWPSAPSSSRPRCCGRRWKSASAGRAQAADRLARIARQPKFQQQLPDCRTAASRRSCSAKLRPAARTAPQGAARSCRHVNAAARRPPRRPAPRGPLAHQGRIQVMRQFAARHG